MNRENLLMVADSEHDANMLYAVGFFVPDPFIYLSIRNRGHIIIDDLELGRAREQARHCRVLSLSHCQQKLRRQGVDTPQLAQVIRLILRQRRLKKISVPADFPFGLAQELRRCKIKVRVKKGHCFPARQIKSAEEVKKISAALIMAEVGLAEAIQVLKSAKVGRNGQLQYHDVPLTADKLRAVINVAVLQAGGVAEHTIVAGGCQGCNPHESGHGVLRAHQPIILDIFPRSQKTGYFGDISRTVVKGRASEAVRKLYQTVLRAQAVALAKIRHRTPASEVHKAVQAFFEQEGYKTGRHNGCLGGFLHGTGHGLGLENHEPPRLNAYSEDILQVGQVVTVEPGLYYPPLGGVRLEDVVQITRQEPHNLTKFEKTLEV